MKTLLATKVRTLRYSSDTLLATNTSTLFTSEETGTTVSFIDILKLKCICHFSCVTFASSLD